MPTRTRSWAPRRLGMFPGSRTRRGGPFVRAAWACHVLMPAEQPHACTALPNRPIGAREEDSASMWGPPQYGIYAWPLASGQAVLPRTMTCAVSGGCYTTGVIVAAFQLHSERPTRGLCLPRLAAAPRPPPAAAAATPRPPSLRPLRALREAYQARSQVARTQPSGKPGGEQNRWCYTTSNVIRDRGRRG
eukprot:scaffold866_cov544-Prasinococcus_capsulatus_cf.AAC.3